MRSKDPKQKCGDSRESSGSDVEDKEAEEGTLRRCASALLRATWWNNLVISMILVNTLIMAIQCDKPNWSYWYIVERVFLAFFVFEMALRLFAAQFNFFLDPDNRYWNIFELIVVLAGCAELVLERASNPKDPQVMFALRACRLFRILRACRIIRHFKQLLLLVQGFISAAQAVFWIGVLFSILVFISSIIVTTMVGQHAELWAKGHHAEPGDVDKIKDYFGTLLSSMLTMFQLVTMDDWSRCSKLVSKRMPFMTMFFIAYIQLTAFAMVALLTGVMAENVNSVSQENEKEEEERSFQESVATLKHVFLQSDSNNDDGLSLQEITNLLHANPEVKEKLQSGLAPIAVEDIADIFHCMDVSGDGKVNWEEFREGMNIIRGPATAKQAALLRAEVCQMQALVREVLRAAPGRAVAGESLASRVGCVEERLRLVDTGINALAAAVAKGRPPAAP